MRFGLNAWVTPSGMAPDALATTAESLGFESLFFPEHTHIPVDRETPYVGGGELPEYYADSYDPFVALATAAAATTSLRLGTGICLVSQRDPIILARESATLDRISGGRLLLGVGAGWNREEMRNHGTDPKTRYALLAERMEAVRALWRSDPAEYHGRHVAFDPIRQGVKPLQAGGPPVLVALDAARHRGAVGSFGSDWFPTFGRQARLAERAGLGLAAHLRRAIAALHEDAEATGRRPPRVTINGAPDDPAALGALAAAGVDRVLFVVGPASEADTVATLRRLRRVAERVAPQG